MEIKNTINNRPVCEPILKLVKKLVDQGCVIEKQVLNDHHFNEMLFILKAPEKFSFDKNDCLVIVCYCILIIKFVGRFTIDLYSVTTPWISR